MNMFEAAARAKFRFQFKGPKTVEDLWDLSLQDLDSIYIALNTELKQTQVESLLKENKKDTELELKIEIVKYIVQVKQAEKDALARAKEIKQNNQRILEIIAEKEDAADRGKSIEELKAMLQ